MPAIAYLSRSEYIQILVYRRGEYRLAFFLEGDEAFDGVRLGRGIAVNELDLVFEAGIEVHRQRRR